MHFNFKGTYLLAKSVFSEVGKVLSERIRRVGSGKEIASEADCAERLAFTDWDLHYKYGKLLTEDLGDYLAAGQEYRLVQSLLPHSWVGYNALGSVLHAQSDVDGAISEYKKAIQIKPTCDPAHYHLAWAYKTKGQFDKAIEHFSELARLKPDSLPAYENIAKILAKEGKLDEAVEILRKGLVFNPQSIALHVNLGSLLKRQGKRDDAIREFRVALELDPNSAPIRGALESLLKAGQ